METTTTNSTNITTDATSSPDYIICPQSVPNSSFYLKQISASTEKAALFSFFGLLCGLTLLIYVFEIVSILRNKMHIMRRIRMVMLLSLYPVFSSLALLAVIVPRAAPLLDLVTNVYFAITLWHFIQLMLMYYGGEKKMIEDFGQSPVSIQVPPICCLFVCFPKFRMNKKFLFTLKLGATQFLIFRPILLVISMILWVEDRYEYVDEKTGKMQPFRSASTYIALVNMGTTLLAMWPLIIIFRASLQRLSHFHIRGKFIVFQLVMICGSLQDAILTQVANFNFLNCTQYLPVKSWALEIHHLAIIGEMFILSVAALAVYWKYIRENIPLDFHHPINTMQRSNSDFDCADNANSSDDGNTSDHTYDPIITNNYSSSDEISREVTYNRYGAVDHQRHQVNPASRNSQDSSDLTDEPYNAENIISSVVTSVNKHSKFPKFSSENNNNHVVLKSTIDHGPNTSNSRRGRWIMHI